MTIAALQKAISPASASEKINAKYGQFVTGGKLSENQAKFIKSATRDGLEVFAYSGRGMFGDKCPAVSVRSLADFKPKAKSRFDCLGRDFVVYAQV